jgi:hypothetical protein
MQMRLCPSEAKERQYASYYEVAMDRKEQKKFDRDAD